MAKQTFSVGQVLSAAQMTNLQQTALGGGAPVTKTASYTLVAADAGTVIQMNSASPTTITVNTALFAAGDTVFIQNIGAGTCTVTAGTATVDTAGSLALTQWEGGTLYFTSTSASIFFDYIQAGVSIPLTTKGDLFGFNTANARVPIGTNGQVLTADSTQALGLKWATPAGGGAYTLLSTTTLSGTSTTVSSISGSYKDLRVVIVNCSHDGGGSPTEVYPRFRFNGDSGANYSDLCYSNNAGNGVQNQTIGATTQLRLSPAPLNNTSTTSQIVIDIFNYANTTVHKQSNVMSYLRQMENGNYAVAAIQGAWLDSSAITSISFILSANSWDNGTVYIYGVN